MGLQRVGREYTRTHTSAQGLVENLRCSTYPRRRTAMPPVSWPFLSLLWTTTSLRSPVHSSLEGRLAWSGSH